MGGATSKSPPPPPLSQPRRLNSNFDATRADEVGWADAWRPMSQLLTVVLTTSPVSAHPSTAMLEEVIGSFALAPGLRSCATVLVCDGVKLKPQVGQVSSGSPGCRDSNDGGAAARRRARKEQLCATRSQLFITRPPPPNLEGVATLTPARLPPRFASSIPPSRAQARYRSGQVTADGAARYEEYKVRSRPPPSSSRACPPVVGIASLLGVGGVKRVCACVRACVRVCVCVCNCSATTTTTKRRVLRLGIGRPHVLAERQGFGYALRSGLREVRCRISA